MKTLCVGLLVPLLASGCFKTKDELELRADGSGTVRLETLVLIPTEMFAAYGGMGRGERTSLYPPANEADAKAFFPAKDFTVTVREEKAEGGDKRIVVTAAFKDVNALLASPYGRAHQLSLRSENDTLRLQAVNGFEGVARLAEAKDESGMLGARMPGLAELEKKKKEMRSEFRVTLPQPISAANGQRDGQTAAWVNDRATSKDAEEFIIQAGKILEASCPATGVQFTPNPVPRLALGKFQNVPIGVAATKSSVPEAAQVKAAAKFLPCALSVTRSLDLTGEGQSGENQAQLLGLITVPPAFAPQQWGEVKLEEVTDANGADLKPQKGDELRGPRSSYSHHSLGDDNEDEADEEGEGDGAMRVDRAGRHFVTLTFAPPEWKVQEVTRIKASIPLRYYSGAHVVAVSNAIPGSWIPDQKGAMNFASGDSERSISHPGLVSLGLAVKFGMGMVQAGLTMLTLNIEGDKASVTDGQVFDADGRPWPTWLGRGMMGDQNSCTLLVAGTPKAPLSLALIATGLGASVDVPILLEHVPVSRPSP